MEENFSFSKIMLSRQKDGIVWNWALYDYQGSHVSGNPREMNFSWEIAEHLREIWKKPKCQEDLNEFSFQINCVKRW